MTTIPFMFACRDISVQEDTTEYFRFTMRYSLPHLINRLDFFYSRNFLIRKLDRFRDLYYISTKRFEFLYYWKFSRSTFAHYSKTSDTLLFLANKANTTKAGVQGGHSIHVIEQKILHNFEYEDGIKSFKPVLDCLRKLECVCCDSAIL